MFWLSPLAHVEPQKTIGARPVSTGVFTKDRLTTLAVSGSFRLTLWASHHSSRGDGRSARPNHQSVEPDELDRMRRVVSEYWPSAYVSVRPAWRPRLIGLASSFPAIGKPFPQSLGRLPPDAGHRRPRILSAPAGIAFNHGSSSAIYSAPSRLVCRAVRCSAIARLASMPKVRISFSTSGVQGRP